MSKKDVEMKETRVAVAVDKDKGSQYALKWAVDHLLNRDQALILLHVKTKPSSVPSPLTNSVSINDANEDAARTYSKQIDTQAKELFIPFRCFCTRREIKCKEVLVEDTDIARAIIDYATQNVIDTLILGTPSRGGLVRKFKAADVPSHVSKGAPKFCTVYIIAKGKISSVRSASSAPPARPPPQLESQASNVSSQSESPFRKNQAPSPRERSLYGQQFLHDEIDIKSPFTRGRGGKPYEPSIPESDISFVSSSGKPSSDRMFPSFSETSDSGMTPRLSSTSEYDSRTIGSAYPVHKSIDMMSSHYDFSSNSQESGRMSWSTQSMEDAEAEMIRLRLELKQTMDMYSTACKEALTAKQKARELHLWKLEEEQRIEEARLAGEAAMAIVEKEKAKSKAAIEAAEAAQRIAELEAQKRMNAEMRALRESEEKKRALQSLAQNELVDIRYRRYTIEEIEAATQDFSDSLKIGEGGYGPVYKSYLDHTAVAIKVLRPDAAQGRSQFLQEVEVLTCIRHPNMVLLLGACPEYGCLVYEYMANGSLDDRLFRRGNSPPLSWQLRFKVAAEIGTGLLFLHQTKPEPIVHRDLKPGNILLDRNYVSKISDVGLARLVPPSVANNVTQYRMTATAGTFCYIDPEYQQTGMLGIKSDIYSLGIMLLQIITAKPPMGLTHHVERAIEEGTFADILDPAVSDWPIDEALNFAKLALHCAELRRKDRPHLGNVVLPELNRLRALAEENMSQVMLGSSTGSWPSQSQVYTIQDVMSDQQSGCESSKSQSSTSSFGARR